MFINHFAELNKPSRLQRKYFGRIQAENRDFFCRCVVLDVITVVMIRVIAIIIIIIVLLVYHHHHCCFYYFSFLQPECCYYHYFNIHRFRLDVFLFRLTIITIFVMSISSH